VRGEARVRHPRALVVPGHDEHWHPAIGQPSKRLERLPRNTLGNPRPIENIAAMHYPIDFAGKRRLERSVIISNEVVTAPRPIDARPKRQIQSKVRVGEEENAEVGIHMSRIRFRYLFGKPSLAFLVVGAHTSLRSA
jgi:hypothetical protein